MESGIDLVECVNLKGGIWYSDWLSTDDILKVRMKKQVKLKGIRKLHCFEFSVTGDSDSYLDKSVKISAWKTSSERWNLSKTITGRWRTKTNLILQTPPTIMIESKFKDLEESTK